MSERPAQYIVAVGSGKGGVGKAFDAVAAQVFDALQRRAAA